MLRNVVKTHSQFPEGHDNNRSLWKIPMGVFLPKFTVGEVGVTLTGATNVRYPPFLGAAALLKSVKGIVNGNVIFEIDYIDKYALAKFLQNSNANQKSVQSLLRRTSNGFSVRNFPSTSGMNTWFPVSQTGGDAGPRIVNKANYASAAYRGTIDLSDFIEFLIARNVPGKPGAPEANYLVNYPNFMIEIEWNDPTTVLQYDGVATGYTILKPILIYEEVIDPGLVRSLPKDVNLQFDHIVPEYKYVPAINQGTVQDYDITSKAMVDKYLRDLLWVQVPFTDFVQAQTIFKSAYSAAQVAEQTQFVLNGSTMVPGSGIVTPAQKAMYLLKTRGGFVTPLFSYLPAVQALGDITNLMFYQSRLSIGAIPVNSPVASLRVQHRRTGGAADFQRGVVQVFYFGRVIRTLKIQDGKVEDGYPVVF